MDDRIKIILKENEGVSVARNRGIQESKTEIIAFLDADDEWLPGFLSKIYELVKKFPDAGLYGTAYYSQFPEKIVKKAYLEDQADCVLDSYFYSLAKSNHVIFNSSSFAAKKNVLLEIDGFDESLKWNEDGALWFSIALRHPVAFSPEPLSIYYKYTNNNSNKITEYLYSPFLKKYEEYLAEARVKHRDHDAIMQCVKVSNSSACIRNIFNYYGERVRRECDLLSQPVNLFKLKILFMTFIPKFFIKYVNYNAENLSIIKHKVIRHH